MADETIRLKFELDGADRTVETVKSLKQQIKEAKTEALQFEEGSAAFSQAAQRAADLEKRLGAVNDEIGLLKGDALEKVANGFKGVGSAILSLDTGKLAQANQSLKSIPFDQLTKQAGAFGKELFKLATNPLFLIPTLISLIIANFDKLLELFPGLGAAVDGVKIIFEKLVGFIKQGIDFALDLYNRFKTVLNVIFPLLGVIDLLVSKLQKVADEEKALEKERQKASEEAEKRFKDQQKREDKIVSDAKFRIDLARAEGKETKQLELEYLRQQKAQLELNVKRAESIAKFGGIYKQLVQAALDESAKGLEEIDKQILLKETEIQTDRTKKAEDSSKKAADLRNKELEEIDKFNQSVADSKLKAEDLEVLNTQRKFDAIIELAKKNNQDTTNLEIEKEVAVKAIRKKYEDGAKKEEDDKLAKEREQREKLIDQVDEFNQRLFDKRLSADALEIEQTRRKFEEIIAIATLAGEDTAELIRLQGEEIARIEAEQAKNKKEKKEAEEKALKDLIIESAFNTLSTLSSLTELFAGKSEKAQKRAFQIQKGISIAQTAIATYESATESYLAFAKTKTPAGVVAGFIAAAAAVAAGLANIKKIQSQQFNGGGDRSSSSGSTSIASATSAQPFNVPRFNLSGQEVGIGGASVPGSGNSGTFGSSGKVFVTETDISNVIDKVNVIENNSKFG
jgi:hypothetical protein